jgi:cell division protein FtsZ
MKQRKDLGLPENVRLYGCPQTLFKLHPDFDAVLAKILLQDPKGYIVLIGGEENEIGRKAAESDRLAIEELLVGADMVFITAGMGGGTGTGAAPVVAKVCKDLGILTIAIVTLPFNFEAPQRMSKALRGISTLRNFCDTLIIIPNEKLLSVIEKGTTAKDSFKMSDSILLQAAQGLSDLINQRGEINLDFADVESVMRGMGDAVMGSGIARGEERAVLAAQQAIASPLLDTQSISGARGAIVNITANKDMTLEEVSAATKIIYEEAGKDVNLFFGYVLDENMGDELKVTVIATGFNSKPIEQMENSQDILRGNYNRKSEEIMEIEDTPLFKESNSSNSSSFNKNEEINLEEEGDGPTLVFGDGDDQTHEADQSHKENHENESDIPAYLRKQNQ